MTILDCTLRDGGYYTNWDFEKTIVSAYLRVMARLPIECIEIGYRSNPSKEYLGQFGYTPVSTIEAIRKVYGKKIAVMLNEKSTTAKDLDVLLEPICGLVDIVRIAVDPKNFERAVGLAKAIKELKFNVSFNMMYLSTWKGMHGLLNKLSTLNNAADILCMVDSYGGICPKELKDIIVQVRGNTNIPLGFHGHNNLQLALINTLTAIENGVEYVDATVLGMGRGAGNLKLELLLTYLNKHLNLEVDFNTLGDVITVFEPLREQYRWGTNLPYMISGANDIPQKDVMEWVSNRRYPFNTIVRALDNRRNNEEDNARFPVLKPRKRYGSVLVVGGGGGAAIHADAIKQYLLAHPDMAIVFATARHADKYLDVPNDHYYCLAGNESRRLMKTAGNRAKDGTGILAPYPRAMGTDVPECMAKVTFELPKIDCAASCKESVTTIALQLANLLTEGDVVLAGYDGYPGQILSEKEIALSHENQVIFTEYARLSGRALTSLTPTLYPDLHVDSVYRFL